MINKTNFENKFESEKPVLDNYSGFLSTHFQDIAISIDIWCKKKNIRLSGEFWFLTVLLFFLIVNRFFPNLIGWSLIGILILWIFNLLYPNTIFIRKKFFKTPSEKVSEILKKNDQDAILELRNYLTNKGYLGVYELDLIFNERFRDNYEAYNTVFKKTKLSEKEIGWFLDKKVMLMDFFDTILIRNFIKSCRVNISNSTYTQLIEQLNKKKVSKSIKKYFNYRFVNYSCNSSVIKKIVSIKYLIYRILMGTFIIVFFALLLISINPLTSNDQGNSDAFTTSALGFVFLFLIFLPFINLILDKLMMLFIRSDLRK